MYTFITKLERIDLLKRQLPSFLSALILAELFYKFHSFVLECVAFLATWFVIDGLIGIVFPNRDADSDRRPS